MNIYKIIAAIMLTGISLASCRIKTETKDTAKQESKPQEAIATKSEQHWSYVGETGPEHWAEIEKKCSCDGKHQSPVNIISINAESSNELLPLDIHYNTQTKIHDVTNNGHSIQYNFEEGDYINYNGEQYDLKQIHFHESSEHAIDGIRYPLEMHMVHANARGEYLVLGIMAKEGKSSAPFDFLEKYIPIHQGETITINAPFDLNLNLPKDKGYFNYVGSLTTPPCTEGVNWIIFKKPITVSLEQVKILKENMPINNYRIEQPLNDRKVKKT